MFWCSTTERAYRKMSTSNQFYNSNKNRSLTPKKRDEGGLLDMNRVFSIFIRRSGRDLQYTLAAQ